MVAQQYQGILKLSTGFNSVSIRVADFWGVKLDYTTLELRVSRDEFLQACSDGDVKGKIVKPGTEFPYIFVELGKETNYRTRIKDDANTEFRRFIKCHVFATDTEEKLNSWQFLRDAEGVTVIIYC